MVERRDFLSSLRGLIFGCACHVLPSKCDWFCLHYLIGNKSEMCFFGFFFLASVFV